jgi:hypothetical protein
MPSVAESLANTVGPFAAAAQAGVDVISENATITFTKYVRVVLPLDGFVFWVRSDLVSPAQGGTAAPGLLSGNSLGILTRMYGVTANTPAKGPSVTVAGSLHYATDQNQEEDSTWAYNNVIFTAESEVEDFNSISPTMMLLGTIDDIRFAFASRGPFYQTAGLWHYRGASIEPTMQTQIIDNLADLRSRELIVSNSLPIWLALNQNPAVVPIRLSPIFPLYPSFAVPDNLRPPYGAVHIVPESLEAIQGTALYDRPTLTSWQLVSEQVRITLYGLNNNQSIDFLNFVSQYTLFNEDLMGIMNMPTVRDEKKTSVEINTLAQKKTITFVVNYYQARLSTVARQLVKHCIPDFFVGGPGTPWQPLLPIAPPLSLGGQNFTVAGETFDVEQSYAGS